MRQRAERRKRRQSGALQRACAAFLTALAAVSVAGCDGRRATDDGRMTDDGRRMTDDGRRMTDAGRGAQEPGAGRESRTAREPRTARGQPAPYEAVFRDVAKDAGLQFRWGHGGKTPLTIIETIGHGCAFLDYDQDGLLDVFLVGNRKCALFRNVGGGRFEDVTPESGLDTEGELWGVATGDYDNDGYPDLYVTGYGKCVLYHNVSRESKVVSRESKVVNRQGQAVSGQWRAASGPPPNPGSKIQSPKSPGGRRFVDVTARSGLAARGPYDVATAAAFADLDSDGRLDLFVGRYIVFTPRSIQFCTYGGVRAGCGVKNYEADKPRVYRNTGNGSFTEMTGPWGFAQAHGKCLGVAVRASDSGRGVELYAANDELPADHFVRSDDGRRVTGEGRRVRYSERGTPVGTAYNQDGLTQGGMGTDWGDYDNDGFPDLVVSTFQGEPNSLYHAEAELKSNASANSQLSTHDSRLTTRYTEVGAPMGIALATAPLVAWTAKFLDVDNDGYLDLFFTNGHTQDNVQQTEPDRSYPQPMLLYRNEKGKRFLQITGSGAGFAGPFVGRGAAAGDFDNDGLVDLLAVDEEGPVKLLRNEDGSGNHWMGVRLAGGHCNRDGIGARVSVTAGGRTVVRDQQLAGGYISAQDPRLHFGLGSASQVEELAVRWPCGRVDRRKNLPADRYVTVTEGR